MIITKPHVWLFNDTVTYSRMTWNDWYVMGAQSEWLRKEGFVKVTVTSILLHALKSTRTVPCSGGDSKPAPLKDKYLVRFITNSWAGTRRQMRSSISALVFSVPPRRLLPVSITVKLPTQQWLPSR
jgi:hypothetical protein